jgi:transcriptional regulator with XRE-family HTH domain
MDSRKIIAHNLKQFRLLRRLSQEALALEAGVDRTYVGGLERGSRNPSVDMLDKLAKTLAIKTSDFFTKDVDSPIPAALPRGRRKKSV